MPENSSPGTARILRLKAHDCSPCPQEGEIRCLAVQHLITHFKSEQQRPGPRIGCQQATDCSFVHFWTAKAPCLCKTEYLWSFHSRTMLPRAMPRILQPFRNFEEGRLIGNRIAQIDQHDRKMAGYESLWDCQDPAIEGT